MQDHAKQGYTFGYLSLIRSLALDIPSKVTTVRDLESASQKREIYFMCFLGHLSFSVSGVESPFIFYTKNKKNYILKYMTE